MTKELSVSKEINWWLVSMAVAFTLLGMGIHSRLMIFASPTENMAQVDTVEVYIDTTEWSTVILDRQYIWGLRDGYCGAVTGTLIPDSNGWATFRMWWQEPAEPADYSTTFLPCNDSDKEDSL